MKNTKWNIYESRSLCHDLLFLCMWHFLMYRLSKTC